MATKSSKTSIRLKTSGKIARAKKLKDKSSEQPIECVFSDMSERLMRIQRDLLMPAFVFQREGFQNTITMFGSARIKPEHVAKAEYESLLKRNHSTKRAKEALGLCGPGLQVRAALCCYGAALRVRDWRILPEKGQIG